MSEVAVPGKASTIIVARAGGGGGFEVLMTRRSAHMKVLGGFFVFPGGGVEEDDWSEKTLARCRGLSPIEAQHILGATMTPEQAMGHWVAAIRELFEETGIHFFDRTKNLRPVAPDGLQERLAQNRQSLWQRRLTLAALLESEQLFCDVGRLTYLFHRITPDHYPVRFDTRFYVASLPKGQTPLAFSEEVAESVWLNPQEALQESESGRLPMMPPTLIALRTLASLGTWENFRSAYRLGVSA
jgi:8-oxo-dGTP pyrophosphatase MutT (NUDIX family)